MSARPLVLAFLLCDQVIREAGTGKWSAIGIFDQIIVENRFPAVHPSLAMYCRLTDAEGDYELSIDIGRLTENGHDVIGEVKGLKLRAKDRTRTGDFGIVTRNLVFPEAGRYQVRLLANGELLGEYPLLVLAREQPDGAAGTGEPTQDADATFEGADDADADASADAGDDSEPDGTL